MSSREQRRGLTLVEVLIVVVVIAILSSTGVVVFRSTRTAMQLNTSANDLKRTLDAARMLAVSRNSFFSVRINLGTNTFWIDEFIVDNSGLTPQLARFKQQITVPKNLSALVHFEDVRVQHIADPILSDGSTETFTTPHTSSEYIDVIFGPSSTSDFAVFQLLQDIQPGNNTTNFYSIKLYSSTAISEVFPDEQL